MKNDWYKLDPSDPIGGLAVVRLGVALLVNRWVIPACLGHICVICFGQVHVHMQNGWFVVGAGQGGLEWGFILLVCLLGVLWAYWPRRSRAPA